MTHPAEEAFCIPLPGPGQGSAAMFEPPEDRAASRRLEFTAKLGETETANPVVSDSRPRNRI